MQTGLIGLRHWFARYADCLIAQIFQTAACKATHTITQRTANWLLAGMARTGGVELEMTQEQLAKTLGVGELSPIFGDGLIDQAAAVAG